MKNLENKEHKLIIRADNRFSEKSALHIPNDYMSYGGVSRPVVLEELNDAYTRYIHIIPFYQDGKWKAEVEAVSLFNLWEIALVLGVKNAGFVLEIDERHGYRNGKSGQVFGFAA